VRVLVALFPLGIGAILLPFSPGAPHAITCFGRLASASIDHLARCDRGAVVRTSSADLEHASHPLYLIDGRVGPPIEKWASFPRDRRPWIEVFWNEPKTVRRIVLHHAGVREHHALSTADFEIRLRTPEGWKTVASVRDNRMPVTVHEFPPTRVTAVRLEVLRANRTADPRARLYELAVHGE
jgi:hypothetical protein